jgi:hypothetical protein
MSGPVCRQRPLKIRGKIRLTPARTQTVEKGLAGTALDCQSAVPKPEGSSASMSALCCDWRKGNWLKFQCLDVGFRGNATERGDGCGGPGRSSGFDEGHEAGAARRALCRLVNPVKNNVTADNTEYALAA